MANNKSNAQNRLTHFFLITFIFSWTIWGLGVILSYTIEGELPFWIVLPIIIIGAFGPSVAAVWLTRRDEGNPGVIALLKRGIQVKGIPIWIWVSMFLIPVSAMLITIFLVKLEFGVGALSIKGLLLLPLYILIMYLGGSVQEEFGWRGYALDRLQAKWNALNSSIILGIIWATWHLPLFFIEGAHQQNMTLWLYYISVTSIAIIMTWLHNNSKANIFVAMTYHSIGNSVIILADAEGVGQDALGAGEIYNVAGTLVFAILIVAFWGPRTLTKS